MALIISVPLNANMDCSRRALIGGALAAFDADCRSATKDRGKPSEPAAVIPGGGDSNRLAWLSSADDKMALASPSPVVVSSES